MREAIVDCAFTSTVQLEHKPFRAYLNFANSYSPPWSVVACCCGGIYEEWCVNTDHAVVFGSCGHSDMGD